MTKDEIIRLARDAGFDLDMWQLSFGCEAKGSHKELERFAALVLANNPPQSSMAWQEGYAAGCATADKDMKAMRQLAAGKCTISKVVEELGPLSLWSKDGLEREIGKAVAAEREACARVCERMWHLWLDSPEDGEPNKPDAEDCYRAIRARGTHDQG